MRCTPGYSKVAASAAALQTLGKSLGRRPRPFRACHPRATLKLSRDKALVRFAWERLEANVFWVRRGAVWLALVAGMSVAVWFEHSAQEKRGGVAWRC